MESMIGKPIDINRYQSMKLVNCSRLVSVNRWSINNHTKIVHQLLSTGTATLNRHHSRYLWWVPDATWSPGDEIGKTIPTQSSQRKGYTPLHMYSNNPLAHHCLSVSSGVFNWWKSMIGKPINQSIPINNHTSLNHWLVIDYQYQSINWYRLSSIIDFIDWIPRVKCMIMRSFRTFVLSRLFTYMFLLYKHQWNTRWDFARKHDIFTCEKITVAMTT